MDTTKAATIDPKAVDAACKAFQKVWSNVPDEERARWPDDYDIAEIGEVEMCMTAALIAAAPFIRESVVEECADISESYGAKVTGFSIVAQKGAEGASRIIASRIRALMIVSAPPSDDPPEPGVYSNDGPFKEKEPRP